MDRCHNTLCEQGYLILRSVIPAGEMSVVRGLTDRIVACASRNLEDPFAKYYLRHRADQGTLYDLYQRHPEFQPLAKIPAVLDALESVLGPDIFLYENCLVYKPRDRRNGVPWHQDFLSRPDEPVKYIAWMAIDNVTRANGAMKIIPGSHLKGFLPWHRVKGETHHDRVNPECVDESKAIHAELAAGDVLVFNQMLLHSSDEVDSELPRRAFRVSYQGFDAISTPRGTPIVLRGGTPESLAQRFPNPYTPPVQVKEDIARRCLHAIGWRLLKA
ncbi:MAG: phytanoyl-CoA dioxygenase family protein [Planctomycetes bacterium]|nr:phytanoyl-CoA dioxygenase family protein [Planctomycetota bacterium]